MCLRFKFGKFFSNDIIKNVLINFCQNLFSDKKGCVICIDNMNTNAVGKIPGTFYGCNLNEGGKNVQLINKENIFDGPIGKLNLNNKNLDYGTTTTTNTSTNNESVDSVNVSHLTICPVQSLTCESTLEKNEYEDSMNTFQQKLNSNSLISQNLGLPNLNLLDISYFNDLNKPNLANLELRVNDSQISGFFSFTVKNEFPLYCNYSIRSETFQEISKDDILKCKNFSRCGSMKINSEPSIVFSTKDNLQSFENGRYFIWVVCMNDIPNPKSISEPENKGSFIIDTYVKIDTIEISADYLNMNLNSRFKFIFVFVFIYFILF